MPGYNKLLRLRWPRRGGKRQPHCQSSERRSRETSIQVDSSAVPHTFRVNRGDAGLDYTLVTVAWMELTPIIENIRVPLGRRSMI
jgi:hypothetical protein